MGDGRARCRALCRIVATPAFGVGAQDSGRVTSFDATRTFDITGKRWLTVGGNWDVTHALPFPQLGFT